MKLIVPTLVAAFATAVSAGILDRVQSPLTGGTPPPSGGPVPGSSPLQFCGPADDNILIIYNIDISPNPPLPGQKLLIKASGRLSETIEKGAYVNLDVKYGYIKLIHQTLDLCENAGQIDQECPVEAGEITIVKEVDLPKAIPPGKYHVQADVYTVDDMPITCITADVYFKPSR
ncbi:phosphatidylinositol transfer protein [Peziza echinospora]|nr:phosphatidylinositol transfer protein [Peziza echinospora]